MADSAMNRNGLKANSNVQQRRLHAQFLASHADGKTSKSAQKALLLGQTIDPKVAENHMNTVEFDGIGRIVAFKKSISGEALGVLRGAVIKPLTQTNTQDERAKARPGNDCMVQFMHLMRNTPGKTARELLGQAKLQWMSGNLSDDAVAKFMIAAGQQLQDAPALQSMAAALAHAVSQPKEATQRNDNMYGRKFESEFVHALIKNPPAGTLEATRKIGQALLADFDKEHAPGAPGTEATLRKLAASIDLRPWSAETPDVEKFMKDPTRDNLKAMLLKVDHGFDILKMHSLINNVSGTFSDEIAWRENADARYHEVLQPARNTRPFQAMAERGVNSSGAHKGLEKKLGLAIETSAYGTGLASHPDYEKQNSFHSAKDSSYGRMNPDMGQLSKMEQQALHHGHAIVTGLSGNANLLTYLSRDIAKKDREFSTEQAALASMMFLVFDGGHSLNEVMAVHTGVTLSENVKLSEEEKAETGEIEKRFRAGKAPQSVIQRQVRNYLQTTLDDKQKNALAQHLEGYHLDYHDIIKLAKRKGNDDEVRAAMDTALDKTIDYFNDNSYYVGQNAAAGAMT